MFILKLNTVLWAVEHSCRECHENVWLCSAWPNSKFLGHSSLPGTLAFLQWAEMPPKKCLTTELCVTETSSSTWCILHYLLLAEEGTAFSPSMCLHDPLELSLRNHPSNWHLWSPSAFQKSARNVRNASAHSSCSYFISYTLLFPVHHFYLHSLTAYFFVQALKTLPLLFVALTVRSLGCTDRCSSPMCCMCLVVPLIMHRSHDWEQTGPDRATYLS